MFLAQVSEHSEGGFVHFFYRSTNYFGCYSFNLLMSAVALLIIPGAILPTWLTVSLPAYAKS